MRNLIVNLDRDQARAFTNKIRLLSWNIAWGYGVGSEGKNYVPKERGYFLGQLDAMAHTIAEFAPDIVFLQEVDFNSDKSCRIDQLKYLSEKLGMNRAYALSWKAPYVPYPYWPISRHFKKVVSGGGILSRFPIVSNEVELWEKPKSNPWWYNAFYLSRYGQFARLLINGEEKLVLNVHLEAFDKTNRAMQARELVKAAEQRGQVFAMGGDFNTTPPGASRQSGFDDPRDDYRNDETYSVLAGMPGLSDALERRDYLRHEERWHTYSTAAPNRKLDYIFAPADVKSKSFERLESLASDHYPVGALIEL